MTFPLSHVWFAPLSTDVTRPEAADAVLRHAARLLRAEGLGVEITGNGLRMRRRWGLSGPTFVNATDRLRLTISADSGSPGICLTITTHASLVITAALATAAGILMGREIPLNWRVGLSVALWCWLVGAQWLWAGIWPRRFLPRLASALDASEASLHGSDREIA